MDIAKFCATNDPRDYLLKPMRHEGYLYATNGHIAVRIADDPAIDAEPMPQSMLNTIMLKMAEDAEERTWQPVPAIDKSSLRNCPHCDGTGRAARCPACDGEGEFEHYGNWYDCKCCDGDGYVVPQHNIDGSACRFCAGSGKDANQSREISGVHIAARYLNLISAEAPGAEIGISSNPLGIQYFRAPGVIGIVMPMHSPG